MPCPNCGSDNIKEQKYDPAELEEVSGVLIMYLVILCEKCKWGFNCTGTLDKRVKKNE